MTMESVTTITLDDRTTEAIRAAFGEHGANIETVKSLIHQAILPAIQRKLSWRTIRCIKGRVNDWRTVELKYNSLFHRDRHIYGDFSRFRKASSQNLSAVVYLDPSRLDVMEGSAVHGETAKLKELEMAAGTVAVFPSCLIHRAVPSAMSKKRRTIVLFDIENPDEDQMAVVHDIVTCPGWTQKPLLHGLFSEEQVEAQMLQDLIANRPCACVSFPLCAPPLGLPLVLLSKSSLARLPTDVVGSRLCSADFWRYFRRGATCRVHWQVTTASDAQETNDSSSVAYNTSFYLIGPNDYPPHVKVHDHRATARYLFNLVRFHLGFEVLS